MTLANFDFEVSVGTQGKFKQWENMEKLRRKYWECQTLMFSWYLRIDSYRRYDVRTGQLVNNK